MGDDQVVARELELAEARLAEAQKALQAGFASGLPRDVLAYSLITDVSVAAIEVGRLRALAWTDDDLDRVHQALVAAGDELQGQGFKVWPLDATVLDRFARAALAAREEAQP